MNCNQQQSNHFNNKAFNYSINFESSKSLLKESKDHNNSSYSNVPNQRKKRTLFTSEEDEQIIRAINEYGEHHWAIVASLVPGRTQRQCRERWNKFLCPKINHFPWTIEEDQLLLCKVNEYGPKWSFLTRFFNNRTDVNLKTRYAIHMRRMKREQEFLRHYKIISKDAITLNISSIKMLLSKKEKMSLEKMSSNSKMELEDKKEIKDHCLDNLNDSINFENGFFDWNFNDNKKDDEYNLFEFDDFDSTMNDLTAFGYSF